MGEAADRKALADAIEATKDWAMTDFELFLLMHLDVREICAKYVAGGPEQVEKMLDELNGRSCKGNGR